MSTYGRNFSFLEVPLIGQRLGRFTTGADALVHGAPVKGGTSINAEGRRTIDYAVNTDAPEIGSCGIVICEQPVTGFHGHDPVMVTPSDVDTAPANTASQVVHGTSTRVRFVNTVDRSFQGQRDYKGRTMVTGIASLAVGDKLGPVAAPSDTNGYWKKIAGGDEGWLRVTKVDVGNGVVEAQFLF